jgi:quercetin dioxygenase-like cupin family protein
LLGKYALPIGHALDAESLVERRVAVKKIALLLLACASLLSTNVAAEETNPTPASKVTQIFDRELPNVPGKSMRAVLVEYGPGASSPSHRHPSSAFIYATVLEGEIRSQVNDAPAQVYKAGETWTEQPGDHHKVSANASDTKPARLLAIFVVDTAEKEIVIPDK